MMNRPFPLDLNDFGSSSKSTKSSNRNNHGINNNMETTMTPLSTVNDRRMTPPSSARSRDITPPFSTAVKGRGFNGTPLTDGRRMTTPPDRRITSREMTAPPPDSATIRMPGFNCRQMTPPPIDHINRISVLTSREMTPPSTIAAAGNHSRKASPSVMMNRSRGMTPPTAAEASPQNGHSDHSDYYNHRHQKLVRYLSMPPLTSPAAAPTNNIIERSTYENNNNNNDDIGYNNKNGFVKPTAFQHHHLRHQNSLPAPSSYNNSNQQYQHYNNNENLSDDVYKSSAYAQSRNLIMSPSPSMSTVSCPEYGELTDRLQRLAIARESLSLQVSVLTEQVGAQSEKIKDLESLLDDKRTKLDSTEGILQDEFLQRTTLETSKLDLLAEVSNLKLKFAALERDKYETEQRFRTATSEISQLQKLMMSRGMEVHQHQQQQQQQPQPQANPSVYATVGADNVSVDPNELNGLVHRLRHRSKEAADEIENLRMTVQQLASANTQKEQQIEQLRSVLHPQQQHRLQQNAYSGNGGIGGGRPVGGIPRSISAYSGMPNGGIRQHHPDYDINQQLHRLLSDDNGLLSNSTSFPESLRGIAAGGASTSSSTLTAGPHQHQPTTTPSGNMNQQSMLNPLQSSSSYTSSLSAITTATPSSPSTWSPRHQPLSAYASNSNAQHPHPLIYRSPSVEGGNGGGSSPAGRQLAAELDELVTISNSSNNIINQYHPMINNNHHHHHHINMAASTSSSSARPFNNDITNNYYTGSLPRNFDAKKPPSVPNRMKKGSMGSSSSGVGVYGMNLGNSSATAMGGGIGVIGGLQHSQSNTDLIAVSLAAADHRYYDQTEQLSAAVGSESYRKYKYPPKTGPILSLSRGSRSPHSPPNRPLLSSPPISQSPDKHSSGIGQHDQRNRPGWLRRHLRSALHKRSTSAPNLAESDDETINSASQLNQKMKRDRKNRSLRNLFSKLKRSSSQELNKDKDLLVGDGSSFKRGGTGRATAGPRLNHAWTAPPSQHIPLTPPLELFNQWAPQQVCDWLSQLGLNVYAGRGQTVIRSGRHLMSMSSVEMEKELDIRNVLHRKKLNLALRSIENDNNGWLDDIGLPQYRDSFAEARIDGIMLDHMTVDDLLQLKVLSAVHQASIGRSIQVLRLLNWNLARIQRKYSPEQITEGGNAASVQLWSYHCVSDWLKTIDLTEFASNLLLAGINGALMVLEPTFTADSLAEVIQMSDSKTLLRRHLSTHYTKLVGKDIVNAKRQSLSLPYHTQLFSYIKVKPLRKGFSFPRKKSKTEVYVEPDELIAPKTAHPASLQLPRSSSLAQLIPPPPSIPESPPDITTVISEAMLENMASSNV